MFSTGIFVLGLTEPRSFIFLIGGNSLCRMAHLMTINDTFQNVWPERWLTTQKGDRNGLITLAVSRDWDRDQTGPRHVWMGCMVLCITFHIAPEQGQGLTLIVPHCSGSGAGPCSCPGTGHSQCDYTIRGEISFIEILLYRNIILTCPGCVSSVRGWFCWWDPWWMKHSADWLACADHWADPSLEAPSVELLLAPPPGDALSWITWSTPVDLAPLLFLESLLAFGKMCTLGWDWLTLLAISFDWLPWEPILLLSLGNGGLLLSLCLGKCLGCCCGSMGSTPFPFAGCGSMWPMYLGSYSNDVVSSSTERSNRFMLMTRKPMTVAMKNDLTMRRGVARIPAMNGRLFMRE